MSTFERSCEAGSAPPSLPVGSLSTPCRTMTGVIGPNGSEKKSLLQSILGGLILSKGLCIVNGSAAYCSQDPWIFSGALGDNIVIHGARGLYCQRYQNGLENDFAKTPGGTEHAAVGELNTNLTGGQRVHVSAARALYSDADICCSTIRCLHVRSDIFDSTRRTSGKTVVLVTLRTSHVSKVDDGIVADSNKTRWSGPTSDFLLQDWAYNYGRYDSEPSNSPPSAPLSLEPMENRLLRRSAAAPLRRAPSANVDFASDDALQRAWQALPASTTMIAIAHRASSLAWMDRVLVIDGSKLVEYGKSHDLLYPRWDVVPPSRH